MEKQEFEDRKRLTFEQAERVEPLPTQLKLKEVSKELRARCFGKWYSKALICPHGEIAVILLGLGSTSSTRCM
jgi:plasmid rolling circle replication initiator protein Rep